MCIRDRPEEALPQLEQMVCTEEMAAALDELRQLCGLMEQYGLDDRLRLDFSCLLYTSRCV